MNIVYKYLLSWACFFACVLNRSHRNILWALTMSPFPFGISIQEPWNSSCQPRSQSHHISSNNHHIWSNIVPVGCKIDHNLYPSRNKNENCYYETISLAGSTQISQMWFVRKNIPWNKWTDVHNFMVTCLWLPLSFFFLLLLKYHCFKLN